MALATAMLAAFSLVTHRSDAAREVSEGLRTSIDDFLGATLQRFAPVPSRSTEIARLEAEVLELSALRVELTATRDRLAELERLLSFKPEEFPVGIAARTLVETSGPFERLRLANAGSDQGVREGFAAVDKDGLVGRVIQVGRRSARILLVSDIDSRVPVVGVDSGQRGLVRGDGSVILRLTSVEDPAAVIEGELLVTSADDGTLLQGIPVGHVVREGEDSSRLNVLPLGGRTAQSYVRLLPGLNVTPPEPVPLLDPPPVPAAAFARNPTPPRADGQNIGAPVAAGPAPGGMTPAAVPAVAPAQGAPLPGATRPGIPVASPPASTAVASPPASAATREPESVAEPTDAQLPPPPAPISTDTAVDVPSEP